MRIKIISDSTCDLPQALIEQYDIAIVPLTVIMGDQEYKDGITINPQTIFDHVAAGGSLCSTSAVSVGEYEEVFASYAESYDAVVHINLGSGFSSCHQNARLAAEEFDNVLVIDSKNLTAGQGLVVLKACALSESCEDLDQLRQALESYTEKIETSFLLDRLDYMVKGGRCSSAAALGANLLNLKPCIEVKEGKLSVVKKYRGSYGKCIVTYLKDRLENREDLAEGTAFLMHTTVTGESLAMARETVNRCGAFTHVWENDAGCTISCHCGPGTLSVVFVRK